MNNGVTVFDYFPEDEDDDPPVVSVVLTYDQTVLEMARMLVEYFGASVRH